MDWAANADEVVIQQLNRLQNTNIVMLGDCAPARCVHSDRERRSVGRRRVGRHRLGPTGSRAATSNGSTAASASCGPASATAGVTSIRFARWPRRQTDHAGQLRRDHRRTSRCAKRLGLLPRLRPKTRRSVISIANRIDGRAAKKRLTPQRPRRAFTPTTSRRAATSRFTPIRPSIAPVTDVVRLPEHTSLRTLIDNPRAAGSSGEVETDAGGVLQSRHRRGRASSTAG